MTRLVLAVLLAVVPSVASADEPFAPGGTARVTLPPGWLNSSLATLEARQQQPPSPGTRDSLKNGALIGAVIGAAALGGFGLFLCHALDDTGGDPDCFPEVLGIAALGAGIGLGAGLAIDVLLVRHAAPAVHVRVRF